jgi:hypothetical protein
MSQPQRAPHRSISEKDTTQIKHAARSGSAALMGKPTRVCLQRWCAYQSFDRSYLCAWQGRAVRMHAHLQRHARQHAWYNMLQAPFGASGTVQTRRTSAVHPSISVAESGFPTIATPTKFPLHATPQDHFPPFLAVRPLCR